MRPGDRRRAIALGLAAIGSMASFEGCAAPPRLIDEVPDGGFAIYRSGRLDAERLAALCRAGVEEVVVMDGAAADRECRLRAEICPQLRVRYDHAQDAREPPSREFLTAFEAWVEQSREEGRKIAFRCRHGWHRTGRLAAFYRLRFQGWNASRANQEMLESGRFMNRYPELQQQVLALRDLVASRPCSTAPGHCWRSGDPGAEGLVGVGDQVQFAVDVCPVEVR